MRFNGIYWDLLKLTGWFHTPRKIFADGMFGYPSSANSYTEAFLPTSSLLQGVLDLEFRVPKNDPTPVVVSTSPLNYRSYCPWFWAYELLQTPVSNSISRCSTEKKKDLRISSWSENLPIQMAQDSSCIKLHQLLCLLCLMLKPTRCLNHHPCYGDTLCICMYAYIYIYPIPIVPQKK